MRKISLTTCSTFSIVPRIGGNQPPLGNTALRPLLTNAFTLSAISFAASACSVAAFGLAVAGSLSDANHNISSGTAGRDKLQGKFGASHRITL